MTASAALAMRLDSPDTDAGAERHRETLVRRLADLLFLPSGQASPHEKGLVDDILSRLYMALDSAMRMRLARRVAELSEPPRGLSRLMAADRPDIARLFLERAGLFDEAELVMLAATTGPEHCAMIARRAHLAPQVTEALASTGDEGITILLLGNPGARFSAAAYAKLTALSRDIPVYQEHLLARADFPAALAHEIFWWAGPARRRHILQRYSMERRLLADAISDLAPAHRDGPADIDWAMLLSGAARSYARARGSDIAALVRWLEAPGDQSHGVALARLLCIDPVTVQRIVKDPGGEPLIVLLKALGLSTSQLKLLIPYLAAGLVTAGEERLDALAALFAQLSTDWADLVLRLWDQQANAA